MAAAMEAYTNEHLGDLLAGVSIDADRVKRLVDEAWGPITLCRSPFWGDQPDESDFCNAFFRSPAMVDICSR